MAHHIHRARTLFERAYVSGPDRTLIEAAQRHKRCIRIEKVRDSLRDYRAELKAALQQTLALTPYPGPGGTRWAIPWYVVACESGGDWGAYNGSSGATGPYQMLPSTYASVCHACDWSQTDQHLAAGRVWDRSGGSEWVCA